MLPHLQIAGADAPPTDEGWPARRKYLDSKEMLGNLIRIFQERLTVNDPAALEQDWRTLVRYRNDVVHHLVPQPFAKCETADELRQAIEYVQVRRMHALPLLEMLDSMMATFVQALLQSSEQTSTGAHGTNNAERPVRSNPSLEPRRHGTHSAPRSAFGDAAPRGAPRSPRRPSQLKR